MGVGRRHVAGERAVNRATVEAEVVAVGKAVGVAGGQRGGVAEGAATSSSATRSFRSLGSVVVCRWSSVMFVRHVDVASRP